jgi:hypothetical protein
MIINLKDYANEAQFILQAAKPFIIAQSINVLDEIKSDLETGRGGGKAFTWETKRPMKFKEARDYDRRKGTVIPITVEISFCSQFSPISRKGNDWKIDRLETHLKLFRDGNDEPVLHLHIDKKNKDQRGPHLHMQISEECTQRLGMRIGVPRFPFGFLLPTDCLDFALAEFFQDEWGQTQTGAQGIRLIRDAQKARARNASIKLQAEWDKITNKTPVSILQDCYLGDDLRLN